MPALGAFRGAFGAFKPIAQARFVGMMGSQSIGELVMSRQVFSRNTKLDAVKSIITFAACADKDAETRAWAVNRWGPDGAPTHVDKAATPAIEFSGIDSIASGVVDRELFRAVRERALLFRMRGVRRTGFRTRSITLSGSTAVFVGEAKPIPVLQPTLDNVGLEPSKIAALSIWTEEALQSTPGLEQLVFDDLARAFGDALDFALLDPTNSGSGEAPASITNGATSIASTSSIDDDIADALAAFTGNLAEAYWLTCPQVAAGLSRDFQDIGARGGDLAGIPVLTAFGVPDGQLTLVDPGAIMGAWDDEFELSAGRNGAVELADGSLTQNQPTGASLVSLWQNYLISIRGIGRIAWANAGLSAAVSITGIYPNAT